MKSMDKIDIQSVKENYEPSVRLIKWINLIGKEMLIHKLAIIVGEGACHHWNNNDIKEHMTDETKNRIKEIYKFTDEDIDWLLEQPPLLKFDRLKGEHPNGRGILDKREKLLTREFFFNKKRGDGEID